MKERPCGESHPPLRGPPSPAERAFCKFMPKGLMPERMTKFADRCGKPPDNCPYRVHPNGQTMGTDVRKKGLAH